MRTPLAGKAVRIVLGVFLCLTPVTAILVLGYLQRLTRREIAVALIRRAERLGRNAAMVRLVSSGGIAELAAWPTWILAGRGAEPDRLAAHLLRGLVQNAAAGFKAFAGLAATTLPFGVLWLLAWWAGWENSFNKGYEQAWAGPLVWFVGAFLAVVTLPLLPLALAHLAAEERLSAFFAARDLRMLMGRVGWRYLGLCLLHVLAALPLIALRIAPTFIEGFYPGFAALDAHAQHAFAAKMHFWATAYLFLALAGLRRATGRLYARAVLRALGDPRLAPAWESSFAAGVLRAAGTPPPRVARPRMRGGSLLRAPLHAGLWSAYVVLLVIAQFANHDWWVWVHQPLFGLPWLPGPR